MKKRPKHLTKLLKLVTFKLNMDFCGQNQMPRWVKNYKDKKQCVCVCVCKPTDVFVCGGMERHRHRTRFTHICSALAQKTETVNFVVDAPR